MRSTNKKEASRFTSHGNLSTIPNSIVEFKIGDGVHDFKGFSDSEEENEYKGIQEFKIGEKDADDGGFDDDSQEEKIITKIENKAKRQESKRVEPIKTAAVRKEEIMEKESKREEIKKEGKKEEFSDYEYEERMNKAEVMMKNLKNREKERVESKRLEQRDIGDHIGIKEFKICDNIKPDRDDKFPDEEESIPSPSVKPKPNKSKDPQIKYQEPKDIIKSEFQPTIESVEDSFSSQQENNKVMMNKSKKLPMSSSLRSSDSNHTKKTVQTRSGVLTMDQSKMQVINPDEFKIGDAKADIQDLQFDSDSELENMLTDDKISSKKLQEYLKRQEKEKDMLLLTPDKENNNDANLQEGDGNFDNLDEEQDLTDPRNYKIREFKIYDQVTADIDNDDNIDEEGVNTSQPKSQGKLRQLANKKKGIDEQKQSKPPLINPKNIQDSKAPVRSSTHKLSKSGTISESQYVRDVNRSLQVSEQNFKEFKINDSISKFDNDKFSEDPSLNLASPTNKEKEILNNIGKSTNIKAEKGKTLKMLNKNQELKKKQQDNEGPREFQLGDGIEADPTEGFESVEGEGEEDKQMMKQAHKQMKQAFKNKVTDYQISKQPISRKSTTEYGKNNINPKEFVLCDNKSLAEIDHDFIEKEKPIFDDEQTSEQKSFVVQSFTEPQEFEREDEESEFICEQSAKINPNEFKLKDGNISKYDENDFDDNSQSNVAKGINKAKQKQKKFEQNFEKKHHVKLNQDLDVNSEQSVRLEESRMKDKKKTAFKEKHKPDEPGVGEIALNYKRQVPVIQDKEIDEIRRKYFNKVKVAEKQRKKAIEKSGRLEDNQNKNRGNSKSKKRNVELDQELGEENEEMMNVNFPESGAKNPNFHLPLNSIKKKEAEQNILNKEKKKKRKGENISKREKGWIGIGFGTGKYAEDEVKKELIKKKEVKSIFNVPKEKKIEEYDEYQDD